MKPPYVVCCSMIYYNRDFDYCPDLLGQDPKFLNTKP